MVKVQNAFQPTMCKSRNRVVSPIERKQKIKVHVRSDTSGAITLGRTTLLKSGVVKPLVKGRERIYLDRFWNEFSADPKKFDEASRKHYAQLYAAAGAMHAGFEQFKAFDQDAADNKAFVAKGMLTMPVLAIGGEKSFGSMMGTVMRAAATNVQTAVVPNSGHWVMEENPEATMKLIEDFLQ